MKTIHAVLIYTGLAISLIVVIAVLLSFVPCIDGCPNIVNSTVGVSA